MVAPTTDLGFTTLIRPAFDNIGVTYAGYYHRIHRYRQAKPYHLVLPYSAEYHHVVDYFRSSPDAGAPLDADDPLPWGLSNSLLDNSSYEKLRGKIYDKVAAGADFAEYRQSSRMIEGAATTLLRSYRAVKTLRFGDAAKALRMQFVPKGASALKSAGQNWLAFHFGWTPLVHDIYDACKILNDPVKSFSYERARASERVPYVVTGSHDFGAVLQNWTVTVSIQSVTQGARVRFSKPGTEFTLNQWGIDNPASIAWELVPFSFVVDWFVNVGDFLSSQTDFAGMQIEHPFWSEKYGMTVRDFRVTKPGAFGPSWSCWSTTNHVFTNRRTTLSGVTLSAKKLKPPSLTRAATAISLLTLGLRR